MSLSRRQFLTTLAGGCTLAIAGTQPASRSRAELAQRWSMRRLPLPDPAPVITAVAVDHRGRWVAAGGDDHRIHAWELPDGQLTTLTGHRDWIRDATFVGRGTRLATAGNDRQIRLWDVPSGVLIAELPSCDTAISGIAADPEGTALAAVGFDQRLRVYDLADGRQVSQWQCDSGDMRTVTFSPDGQLIASGGRDGQLHVWSWPDGRQVHCLAVHRRRIRSVRFSADGRKLISGGEDRVVRILDLETAGVESLPDMPAMITALALVDSKTLAVAASDNRIYLWDLIHQQPVGTLDGHAGTVAALASRESLLVSGGYDTTVRVWTTTENVASRPDETPDKGRRPRKQ